MPIEINHGFAVLAVDMMHISVMEEREYENTTLHLSSSHREF